MRLLDFRRNMFWAGMVGACLLAAPCLAQEEEDVPPPVEEIEEIQEEEPLPELQEEPLPTLEETQEEEPPAVEEVPQEAAAPAKEPDAAEETGKKDKKGRKAKSAAPPSPTGDESPAWNLDLGMGYRYGQDSIPYANAPEELVIPSRKAKWEEAFVGKVEAGRRIFKMGRHGQLRLGLLAEWYSGAFNGYGSLVDRDGSLYRYSLFVRPPDVHANGDEFFLPYKVGKISETDLMVTLTHEFRIHKKFRPFLKVGLGQTHLSYSDANLGNQVNATVFREWQASGADDRNSINCQDANDITGSSETFFFFGACEASSVNPEFWSSIGCSDGTKGCVIPEPVFSVSVKDGMEYAASAGINFHFTQRWAFNAEARYVWSKAKISIDVNHPLQDENTCLRMSSGEPSDEDKPFFREFEGGWFNNCLVFKEGDVLWIQNGFLGGVSGDSAFGDTNYMQFKGGKASLERWEVFLGVRFMFGKLPAAPPA